MPGFTRIVNVQDLHLKLIVKMGFVPNTPVRLWLPVRNLCESDLRLIQLIEFLMNFLITSRPRLKSKLNQTQQVVEILKTWKKTLRHLKYPNNLQSCHHPKNTKFDFGSEDDSEVDSITVENTWRGDSDSDDDSVDSEMENPLKHAGAYSAEEVIRIMRDKLVRLQELYIDQFQRLQYLLKEERRQYKTALRKEHEAELMSIQKQPKETPEDKIAYDQLKALNHYNKPAGMEAVLHAKLMERRIQANSNATNANSNLISTTVPGSLAGKLNTTSPIVAKCSFNFTSSTKCGDICIPMTKFCQKHIINDPNQVLFRRCGFVVASEDEYHTDDGPCETPIPDVFDTSTCVYHTQFQQPFRTSLIELDAMAKLKQRDENEKKRAQLATDAMNMMQTGSGTDLNPTH